MTRRSDTDTDTDTDPDPDRDPSRRTFWFIDGQTNSLVWIIGFVVLFTVVGTLAPVFYYQYAAPSTFVEVKSMTVSDADPGATEIDVSLTRTAYNTYAGDLYIELSRYESPTVHRIYAYRLPVVFEEGTQTTYLSLSTPPLAPGTYRVVVAGTVHLPHGVKRSVTWQSNTFAVGNATPTLPPNGTNQTATPLPTPTANQTPNGTTTPTNQNQKRIAPPPRSRSTPAHAVDAERTPITNP